MKSAEQGLKLLRGMPFESLDRTPVFAQELISLTLGDRRFLHSTISERDLPGLRALARRLRLRVFTLDQSRDDSLGVLLGGEKESGSVVGTWQNAAIQGRGLLLGYPRCCIDAFARRDSARLDLIRSCAAQSGREPLPFLLNNAFVFHSRRIPRDGRLERLILSNSNVPNRPKQWSVISWHPCSWRCRPSLAKARRLWSVLDVLYHPQTQALRPFLARPLLYFDWSRYAVLEGRAKGTSAAYSAVLQPSSLLSASAAQLLSLGGEVRIKSKKAEVWRGSQRLGALWGYNPLLLPFE